MRSHERNEFALTQVIRASDQTENKGRQQFVWEEDAMNEGKAERGEQDGAARALTRGFQLRDDEATPEKFLREASRDGEQYNEKYLLPGK